MTRYYYAGGDRVAVRVPDGGAGVLRFLINDQVSSTSLAVNLTSIGSAEMGEMRYYPFGTERFSSGTVSTRRQYTGQIHDLETGLYFYNARYYDPAIGHFVQADTMPLKREQPILHPFPFAALVVSAFYFPFLRSKLDGAALLRTIERLFIQHEA